MGVRGTQWKAQWYWNDNDYDDNDTTRLYCTLLILVI